MKKYLLLILLPLILGSCLQSPAEGSLENTVVVPGINWKYSPSVTTQGSAVRSIAYSGSRYVAVGDNGRIVISGDLSRDWVPVSGLPANINFRSVIWGGEDNKRFIAVGYENDENKKGKIAISTNEQGLSWDTDIEIDALKVKIEGMGDLTINPTLTGIAYGNGRYVVVGERAYSAWSDNGRNWTPVWIAPFSQYGFQVNNQNANTVIFGGGMFVTGGSQGVLAFSRSRGEDWEWAANALLDGAFDNILTLAYGAGTFVAAGSRGKMKTLNVNQNQNSIIPASSWVSQNSGFTVNINAVTFGNGLFLAVGDAGRISLSVDASRWNAVTRNGWGSNDNIYSAVYGSCFVTGGSGLFIYGEFK